MKQANTFVSANFYKHIQSVYSLLSLRETNKILAEENATLRKQLQESLRTIDTSLYTNTTQNYEYITATVISNTVNRSKNHVLLNKGSKQGVEKDMAVIAPNGIIGIVDDVTEDFAYVISVLNTDLPISAKLLKNNCLGSITWNNKRYDEVNMKDIAVNFDVQIGDTVITSGYSRSFPEGILIGQISSVEKNVSGDFYTLRVKLAADMTRIDQVYVVVNLFKTQQDHLLKDRN
jgi:rod shape-determining protein MreC